MTPWLLSYLHHTFLLLIIEPLPIQREGTEGRVCKYRCGISRLFKPKKIRKGLAIKQKSQTLTDLA